MTPHYAFPDVTFADLRAELAREIALRRAAYPRMIEKGRMTRADADRQLALFAALAEDVERIRAAEEAFRATFPGRPYQRPAPAAHRFTWAQRRAALTHELDRRARLYPDWIAAGRLTQDQADRQVRHLACIRALYEGGFDWIETDPARGSGGVHREWRAIETEIAARDGRAQQELSL
ncbi:hypothetical protein [Novosphingobium colocasiae]|uniref:hypothetical protein n=1 Tax=Novosphingobium colocasiae TaxID=1256513 RepID=UPI0035B0D799